jgi:hypothetical protein
MKHVRYIVIVRKSHLLGRDCTANRSSSVAFVQLARIAPLDLRLSILSSKLTKAVSSCPFGTCVGDMAGSFLAAGGRDCHRYDIRIEHSVYIATG